MESLAHAVDNTYKLCCPIKSKILSNKDLIKPWIAREIISNIKKRQHYFALYCQNKIPKDFYTHFRNFVTGQIRRSKKDYYGHKFNAANRDIKRTWRIINNIINTKHRKVEITVKKIIHDDVVQVDSGDIANMFNYYFVDIGRNIAESIVGNNVNHLDYMTHMNQNNYFFFRQIRCYSTEKLICSLKNKSSSISTIPVKILKSICDIMSQCLTNIINRFLTTGVFPESLKKAHVTPMWHMPHGIHSHLLYFLTFIK